MIKEFQKEYENYWKNGEEITSADYQMNLLYSMRDRRLGKEEMDVTEHVSGKNFREEKAEEMSIFTGEEEVEKRIVRFGHTLYKRTEKVKSSYIVKDGLVTTYRRPDNFDGILGRYIRIASEVAVVLAAVMLVSFFGIDGTVMDRLKGLLISLLIVSIPVALVIYFLMKRAKAGHQKRAALEEKIAEKSKEAFRKKRVPAEYEDVVGQLSVQIGMIQYAKEEKEIKAFHVANAEKVLKNNSRVVDYSIGEVHFSEYEKEGAIEYLPAEATIYQLKSNGKTLAPHKERVQVMLERRAMDWKLVEYRVVK